MSSMWMKFAEVAGWALVHSMWELAVVGAAAWVALAMLRRGSAQVRYGVALGFLGLMMAGPIGTYSILAERDAATVRADSGVVENAGLVPVSESRVEAIHVSVVSVTTVVGWKSYIEPAMPYATAGYLAGVGFMMMRFAVGYTALRRMCAKGVALEGDVVGRLRGLQERLGIRRVVRIVESAAVEVPTVVGAWRPMILLPASALSGLPVEHLELLLAHELAHVRRHDYLVNLVQSAIEASLFYHPAAWWLSGVVRQEREHCCDDVAAVVSGDRVGYARALASMESLRDVRVAVTARSGNLMVRVERLLGVRRNGWNGVQVLSISGAVGVAGIFAMIVYLGYSQQAKTKPTTPETSAMHGLAPAKQGMATTQTGTASGREMLRRHIEDFAAAGTLEEVIEQLARVSDAKIQVQEDELKAGVVDSQQRVAVSERDVTLEKALKTVLAEISSRQVQLTIAALDDRIIVSTEEALRGIAVERAYDIRDFLIARTDPVIPPAMGTKELREVKPVASREELVRQVIEAVKTTAPAERWKAGSVREVEGKLIVRQPDDVQEKVGRVLETMRAAHALQIRVDSRLYVLTQETMKKVRADAPPFERGNEEQYATILDTEGAERLFRTAAADRSTMTVSSPRMMLFNGHKGLISISRTQGITTAVHPADATHPEPTAEAGTVTTGVFLQVGAALSSDRRYVVADIACEVRALLGVEKRRVAGVPAGSKLVVEVPKLDTEKIRSTFSVPDGGRLVLALPMAAEQGEGKWLLTVVGMKGVQAK